MKNARIAVNLAIKPEEEARSKKLMAKGVRRVDIYRAGLEEIEKRTPPHI
jgi:hypothetical protein